MHRFPRVQRTVLGAALALAWVSLTYAQGVELPAARSERAAVGQALGKVGTGTHRDAVVAHLATRGADVATAQSLVEVARGRSASGLTQVRMQQQVSGMAVHGSVVRATFNSAGELVHVVDRIVAVPAGPLRRAVVDERQALVAAMKQVHPKVQADFTAGARAGHTQRFAGGLFFHNDPEVTRVLVPQADASLAEGFLVQTWTQRGNLLDHTLVSGNGIVLDVERRTANDSYNVFAIDPGKGGQTIVAGPGAGNIESPSGWLGTGAQTTINISGNNVSAYLDADANNAADSGGTAVGTGNFTTAANLGQAPSTAGNRAVAVQNLFYLNNVIHDRLYRHGFNEVAGNFQVNNFGKGGQGNDPVNAEAQDGSGTDNANFATPLDGSRPRMQMYLWSGPGATHEVLVSPGGATYAAMGAAFGPALTTTGLSGAVAAATPADGCAKIGAAVSGKVALINRGTCDFTVKVLNAQNAGAVGVIIANNANGTEIFSMGGSNSRIRISSVMISQNDGAALRGSTGASATLRKKAVQPLQLDGDLDSDIVYHEYGHGLTWRMIGSMSGALGGAVGEGASDVVAFMVNGDDVIGEYSAANPKGIRRYRYAGYPLTYGNVTGASVHDDGEIYAAAMWRLRELWLASGRSNDSLFDHFVNGMNFTQPTPAFEHMRNGMLDAIALTAGADANAQCTLVWQAFAQLGVGAGASGTATRRGAVTITPSTATRTDCLH